MATPKIVPRADGEGGLGTSSKGWGDSYLTGNLEIQSGGATTLSKIVMGTNANKATIGVSGATDTFFTDTAQGDLIIRADDNNDKVHIGAGSSGIAGMVVTEVSNVGKVGIGTHIPEVHLEILDVTTSSSSTGGNLRLSAHDGASMGSGHRLGVLEFAGTEDGGAGNMKVGSRIESITKAAWDASNNDAKLSFYTSYGDAQQTEKVDIGGITAMNVYHDYHAEAFEDQLNDDQGGGTILKYSPGADDSPAGSELFFLHTDGTWNQTDADTVDTGGSQLLAVGLGASARTTGVLLEGFVRIASTEILNTPTLGAVDGLPLYVSTTAGHFDFTAPSGSGDFVRIVGYAIDDDSDSVLVYFKPDSTFVEIT